MCTNLGPILIFDLFNPFRERDRERDREREMREREREMREIERVLILELINQIRDRAANLCTKMLDN